jgi:hypothetical protein
MSDKTAIVKFLQWLAAEISRTSQEEFAQVLEGKARLVTSLEQAKSSKRISKAIDQDKINMLIQRLRSLHSRDEGSKMLDELNRESLRRVARVLDVSVLSEDGVERLKEKIIYATIGHQIASDAIRRPE